MITIILLWYLLSDVIRLKKLPPSQIYHKLLCVYLIAIGIDYILYLWVISLIEKI